MTNGIKNIVFDFGGVLINLDKQACIDAFVGLGMENVREYLSDYRQDGIFRRLEIGAISPGQFRNEIRSKIGKPLSDQQIDKAWMKFLLDVPAEKLDLLLQLRKKYRVFMLSNTNAIHIDGIIEPVFCRNGHTFDDYFEKAYFSYEIGWAKPDKEIFEYLLKDAGITAGETLFVDDAEANVAAAEAMGFKTYQPESFEDFSAVFYN
ncbi:MAG: HAD family phosphatase [Candidatus Azobacteroides sp.]|nr:HAD family phosphatase [Candidatus Azobacteroides sp.]